MSTPLYPGFPAYYFKQFRLTLTLITSHAGCDFYHVDESDPDVRMLMVWGVRWHGDFRYQGWAGFSSSHRFTDSKVLRDGVLLPTPEALELGRGLLAMTE